MSGRVLIVVTHLLGIGHLVRASLLARALTQAGCSVTLASGGMPRVGAREERFRFVQLPPVRIEGTDFRNLLDAQGRPMPEAELAARLTLLTALTREMRPDLVITEHFPFGRRQLASEFLAVIEAAREVNPACLILSSIRDVLVAPTRVDRLAEAAERVARLFDGVLVHGDASFLPLEASWPVGPELATKLHYTGYLAEPPRARVDEPRILSGEVLVSGGGSAAALPLFEAAIVAAGRDERRRWRILVGHGVAEPLFVSLGQRAPANVSVERARPDFPALLATCAVSVSQCGYNTVLDLLQARRPAVVVPFDAGNETEQALRGAALEKAGIARMLRGGPAGLDAKRLAAAVTAMLDEASRPALAVDLDGARGCVVAIARLLAARDANG